MGRYELKVGGKVVEAPPKELELLAYLAGHPNPVSYTHLTALAACGTHGHGQSKMAKMATSMGIHAKTMKDSSTRALADMVIQGANQGVLDCEKARKDHPHASTGAMQLLDELQQFEEHAAVEMREYL